MLLYNPRMKEFEVLLTDIVGTIINTRDYIFFAFQYAIERYSGAKIDWEQFIPFFGKPARDILRQFTGLSDVESVYGYVNEFQAENTHLISPFPGSAETLEQLRAKGVKIAGITSRTFNTRLVLDSAGIYHLFDVVITGDDVKNYKPHPEGLYKALNHLSITSARAIMMGDAMDDILAGKNAGIKTIGVTYGALGEKIREHNPDFVINDITEALAIVAG